MMSLIEVLDTRDLVEKKEMYNKYLQESPLGELSQLEKAYFQILYDIYFISKREKLEKAYPHLKMTNIESVSICGNANLEENYFGVQFRTGEYIEIGKEKLITI